jgi:hypothetical protein
MKRTTMTKVQINKWMWDRRKKVTESLEAKKLSYPGLLFTITNMETGADLTPSFKNLHSNQPLFTCVKK